MACWLGLLGLASRYTSCPHPLDSCASARLWQRVERQRGEPLAEGALVTVEQEAAALLDLNDEPGRPRLLITPIFHDFFRFFPVFPGTSGRVPWIPGVQTLKWAKYGGKWVENG